jgi:hypothetical protein
MDERMPQDDDYATPIADDIIMMKMKTELKILPDGYIELPTLWKEGRPHTQNNFEYAKKRLVALLALKMMTKNDTLLKDYADVIKKWEASGYIERIVDPNLTRKDLWYWAHFPLVREEKDTMKVHPVFDGAVKFKGSCINDYIHTGPTVINKLVSVMHRFRQYDFPITGDVHKMFLQVCVWRVERRAPPNASCATFRALSKFEEDTRTKYNFW